MQSLPSNSACGVAHNICNLSVPQACGVAYNMYTIRACHRPAVLAVCVSQFELATGLHEPVNCTQALSAKLDYHRPGLYTKRRVRGTQRKKELEVEATKSNGTSLLPERGGGMSC